MSNLIARPLAGEQVLQAFALVRGLYPELSMTDWQRVSDRDRGDTGSELMSLQTVNGSIHAVFFCRQADDLIHGPILQLDHVIVYDLPGRTAALRTLIRVAEQMARERGCEAVEVTIPRANTAIPSLSKSLTARLGEEGYSEHGVRLRRTIRRADC